MATTTRTANPIETAVVEYLAAKGVKFAAAGGRATKRDDWECDAWVCAFERTRDGKRLSIESDYFTGTGHRKLTKMGEMELRRAGKASRGHREQIKRANSVAVAPSVAGVLHSLLMDASGAEQNFHDWCDEYGYDKDSIKAQATYNACCEILAKLRGFFTGTERAEMQDLLQDY